MARQCNFFQRRNRAYKLHWRNMNEKLEAISIKLNKDCVFTIITFFFKSWEVNLKHNVETLVDLTSRNHYRAEQIIITFIPINVSVTPQKRCHMHWNNLRMFYTHRKYWKRIYFKAYDKTLDSTVYLTDLIWRIIKNTWMFKIYC